MSEIDSAYGVFLSIDNTTMFDELAKCNARKRVDIAVKYNGITKEYTLDEFLSLHGFMRDNNGVQQTTTEVVCNHGAVEGQCVEEKCSHFFCRGWRQTLGG